MDEKDILKLKHLLNGKEREIRQYFYRVIDEIALQVEIIRYNGKVFRLSNYPSLEKKVNALLRDLANSIELAVINGIDQAWQLSNDKNRVFLDNKLKGYTVARKIKKIWYDPQRWAREAFKKRRVKGLNLSDRIWNSVNPFKWQLEASLGEGIAGGMAAKKLATRIKRELKNPDKLFRRVRSESGNPDSPLKLSKAALDYHPGQGVYRSSYKNALRVTRTETNIAYRTADFNRWQSQPFVVGIEIRLSNAHPRTDICDALAGKYPKDFLWTGWHPQCICYAVPVLITDAEFDQYERELLRGGKFNGTSVNAVDDAPTGFYKYLDDNIGKYKNYKSKPYWVEDNPTYIDNSRTT